MFSFFFFNSHTVFRGTQTDQVCLPRKQAALVFARWSIHRESPPSLASLPVFARRETTVSTFFLSTITKERWTDRAPSFYRVAKKYTFADDEREISEACETHSLQPIHWIRCLLEKDSREVTKIARGHFESYWLAQRVLFYPIFKLKRAFLSLLKYRWQNIIDYYLDKLMIDESSIVLVYFFPMKIDGRIGIFASCVLHIGHVWGLRTAVWWESIDCAALRRD